MEYVEQSSQEIRLYLVTGDPQLAQFEVLNEAVLPWNESYIRYGILGASHFISIETGEKILTEICACIAGAFTPPTELIKQAFLHELTDAVTHSDNTIAYRITHAVHDISILGDFLSAYQEQFPNLLKQTFPTPESTDDEPVTVVGINPLELEVQIASIHSYPNEGVFVETKSTFKLQ